MGTLHILRIASQYASKTFTIVAGPEEERFLVHEDILSQSPVFRAMVEQPFKEKEERTIRLPEVPTHVRYMISFLYTSVFTTQTERDLENGGEERPADIHGWNFLPQSDGYTRLGNAPSKLS